jgi:osmotically-inducible protein OsmY
VRLSKPATVALLLSLSVVAGTVIRRRVEAVPSQTTAHRARGALGGGPRDAAQQAVDRAIARRVRSAIRADPFLALAALVVQVTSNRGVVRLAGRVPTRKERSSIAFKAGQIAGTKGIDDRVTVGNGVVAPMGLATNDSLSTGTVAGILLMVLGLGSVTYGRRALALMLVTFMLSGNVHAGVFRLRRIVVVGDSLLAGFGSGGFVRVGRPGQVDSIPAFVARRAHVRLPLPFISQPGVPPPLRIVDANSNGRLDRGEVRRTQGGLGFRSDPDKIVRNLAVPGEDTQSLFEKIAPQDIASELITGDVKGRDVLKFLILGLPLRLASVSQLSRARALHPSFLLVWIGNNDVLDMATNTNPDAVTLTPAEFGSRFHALLDALADTQVGMAVANLPDPTGIAALRRAAGEVTSCRKVDGTIAPVVADDLLSIDLDPAELPTPPCAKVLNATQRAAVGTKVSAFNEQIAAAIADTEQTRGIPIAPVDIFTTFAEIGANGVDLNGDGAPDLTTHYLGGIFSLDGIHPTRTGNALVANTFIDAINTRFVEAISHVDVARIAAHDPLAHSAFRPLGEVPFGLIGESEGDDLDSFFTKTFADIGNNINDIRNRIEDIFSGF